MVAPVERSRVLVTGASGFLGGYVQARLRSRGHPVLAPTRADYDLREPSAVTRLFRELRPDVVIHLAAVVGGIGANRRHPGRFFYDNAIMGLLLMEQARLHDVRKFVGVGTVCEYPRDTPVPFREEDLWSGYPEETNAPYGLAKRMLLVQGQAYRREYGFSAIHLLPVNLYGPGDDTDLETGHVIPALIRKCLEARDGGTAEVEVWGDGSATREFLYVEDAAEAIVLATERYDGEEPVNIGSGREISIAELARRVARLTGYRGRFRWDASRPNGQPRRSLDVSRAKSLFGFEASCSLEEGLRATAAWLEAERGRGAQGTRART